jgi:hypothetical protein
MNIHLFYVLVKPRQKMKANLYSTEVLVFRIWNTRFCWCAFVTLWTENCRYKSRWKHWKCSIRYFCWHFEGNCYIFFVFVWWACNYIELHFAEWSSWSQQHKYFIICSKADPVLGPSVFVLISSSPLFSDHVYIIWSVANNKTCYVVLLFVTDVIEYIHFLCLGRPVSCLPPGW